MRRSLQTLTALLALVLLTALAPLPGATAAPLPEAAPPKAAKKKAAKKKVKKKRAKSTSKGERLKRRCLRALRKSLGGDARVAAAKALADLGDPDAVTILEEAVTENPGDVFAYASLVWIGKEPYVGRALEAVRDPKTSTPVVTAYGVAFIRHPHDDVKKRLREIWQDGAQDPLERVWAASTLMEMGDAEPRAFLTEVRDGNEKYAAAIAAGALWSAGDGKSREILLAALENRRSTYWDQAASAFGHHPDPAARPLLAEALRRTRNPYDRVWLAWAVLRDLGWRHGADGAK